MRIIPAGKKYESKAYVIDKEKLITKLDCMCGDFVYRRKINRESRRTKKCNSTSR